MSDDGPEYAWNAYKRGWEAGCADSPEGTVMSDVSTLGACCHHWDADWFCCLPEGHQGKHRMICAFPRERREFPFGPIFGCLFILVYLFLCVAGPLDGHWEPVVFAPLWLTIGVMFVIDG